MKTNAPKWSEAKKLFEWDGSLIDLYIAKATPEDWTRVLFFLRNSAWPLTYREMGQRLRLPNELPDLDDDPQLTVQLGNASVNCHFFGDEEIEFDIDPGEVKEPEYEAVLAFMSALEGLLGKSVCLSGEGFHEHPCFCVTP